MRKVESVRFYITGRNLFTISGYHRGLDKDAYCVNGTVGDGLVAFKLVGLPDTNGKTVPLTLKWKSFSGDKSAVFDYCTQKTVTPAKPAIVSVRSNLNLK